jgi:D-ribose pyranose/furanose isomerase RbsD
MDIFMKATKQKVRWNTTKGVLSVEDVWDLSLEQLNAEAIKLNKEIKEMGEENFLDDTPSVSPVMKLRFDVVIAIMEHKKELKLASETRAKNKAEKEKLLRLLEQREDEEMAEMPKEEILKRLGDIG